MCSEAIAQWIFMRFLSGGDASLEFPNSKSQTRVTGTFRVASPGHQEIKNPFAFVP